MNKVLSILLFSSILSYASAQKISVGARVGAHFANWSTKNPEIVDLGPKSLKSLSFSVPINIGISDMISIQPEIMYFQKGISYLSTSSSSTTEGSNKISYFEIPLLLKLSFLKDSPFNIGVIAGPSIGLALSGTVTETITRSSSVTTTSQAVDFENDYYRKSDISAHIGANASYNIANGKIILDMRLISGFSNLNTYPQAGANDGVTNKGFSISVGYMHSF